MSDAGNGAVAWYQAPEFAEELRNYATSKGWDRLAPEAAAREATKAHREASTMLRTRDERSIRLPETPEDPAWGDVWQKLGAPKDPSGYVFDDVKLADGTPAPAEITEAMRAVAAKHHLPVAAASELTAAALGAVEKGQEATRAARWAEEKAALDAKWGANRERNLYHATIAARVMGVDGIDAFEGARGYGALMEGLVKMGSLTDEPQRLGGDGPHNETIRRTPEEAEVRMVELRKDKGWIAKLRAGDTDAKKLWETLNRQMLPAG